MSLRHLATLFILALGAFAILNPEMVHGHSLYLLEKLLTEKCHERGAKE